MSAAGFIKSGHELAGDVDEDVDVCVIGSGCGGASLACRLAERGRRVAIVEQGGHYTAKDFDQREVHMLAKIDGGRGLDTSADGAVAFQYGNNVGGASVHYWADSYRTPPERLARWALPGHDEAALAPHFAAIERDLNVHVVDDGAGYVNRMNALLRDGAAALGWTCRKVPQARRGCLRSGHCMQGCAYDAKQSQLVTYLPRAIAAGARVYADVRALTLEGAQPGLRGQATSLVCAVLDRATGAATATRVRVKARAFVIAAGGYATPDFLLRQPGVKVRLPHVGEHFFCNPCPMAHALFDEDVIQWRNIPAAWGVEHFREPTLDAASGRYVEGGYLLMANQLHPGVLGACLLVPPARAREIMRQYPRLGGTIAWIDDLSEGRIWLDGARRRVHVPVDGANGLQIRDAWRKQARLLLHVGAREVFFADANDVRLFRGASERELDEAVARVDLRPAKNVLAAPHPGGGARMAASARDGVVDFDHRVHGADNVYVADPSVFPSPPSVDPSLSIMAFSFVCADTLHARL